MGMFAIIIKKERWGFTWPGRTIVLIVVFCLVYIYINNIHSFLAQNKPINTDIMVLEGFLPDYAIKEAMNIFTKEEYKLLLITGKKRMKGSQLDQFENDGIYSAETLVKLGFDREKIRVISLESDIKKDRTYASAKAVRNWIERSANDIKSFNLVSIGCHSRRSSYLYKRVFCDHIKTGIISIENKSYKHEKWWKSSNGFRSVVQETIALIYVFTIFNPDS